MSKQVIDVKRRHPLYKASLSTWDYYMDSYIGGDIYTKKNDYLNTYLDDKRSIISYLYPHDVEDKYPNKFRKRVKRSFYDNYSALPVNTYIKYLYNNKNPIERIYEPESGYDPYIQNINLKGTNIDDFMREWTRNICVYGVSYVMVDKKPLPNGITTLQQQIDGGYRAYANILSPKSIVDWSLDSKTGLYNWVLIKSITLDNSDYTKDSEEKVIYYLWTKEEIYTLDDQGAILKGTEPTRNPLQFIPIIRATYADFDMNGIYESMLTTIADINREIFNIDSMYQEELYKLAFAQLMVQKAEDDYEPDDADQTQSQDMISSSIRVEYPQGTNPPQYLEFPVSALVEKRARKDELIQTILRLAGLSNQTGVDHSNYASGIAMAFAYSDTYTNVSQMAQRMESYERQLWDYIRMYDQNDSGFGLINDGIQIVYPDKFDVTSDEQKRQDYEISKQQLTKSPKAMMLADLQWAKETLSLDATDEDTIEQELMEGYENQRQFDLQGVSLPLEDQNNPQIVD